MERALNLDTISSALGEGPMLPSPAELQERLAQAEIALFLGRGEIGDDLLATAWYLHAVGSANEALELYPIDRQRHAHMVSAHIFDLALAGSNDADANLPNGSESDLTARQMLFAAQVGYLRGGLNPNATALRNRTMLPDPSLFEQPGEVSLSVGSALLALDRAYLFPHLDGLRSQVGRLQNIIEVDDLIATPYGAVARVVEAVRELLIHLTYNRPARLDRALTLLGEAISAPYAQADLDSRWVAAHLREIGTELSRTSVWALLPPNGPLPAARAMTLGEPPVLSLWPPQFDFLSRTPNPLDASSRRMLISFPTSAGKTLLAQYIILSHIGANAGSVCVVVPTHSLAREVRRDLDRRVDLLARQARDAGPIGLELPSDTAVVVMTPEKLLAHLRSEPERMLEEFTLFLIDEAQLLGDTSRGWVLESALAFLHERTRTTNHRIVLLSAALGNRAHIRAWLDTGSDDVVVAHHDWRGPRRVLSLFATRADWDAAEIVTPPRKNMLTRKIVPLYGRIAVRTAGEDVQHLGTTEPVGKLVLVERQGGVWEKDSKNSTKGHEMRGQMAAFLGRHGPILVIESTKTFAQRTARAIANALEDESIEATPLVNLAITRLGEQHPLVDVLKRGVGFHHSALPDDIQAELEDGLRHGSLRYLVATTTLIEGINFPVRSVLVGERSYRTGAGPNDIVTTVDAPRLLNAIGRAGRAGRETEGWVVLWLTKDPANSDFAVLDQADDDLYAYSHLVTAKAMEHLDVFEALIRSGVDAVFEYEGREVADFISHVWFVASALEELDSVVSNPIATSLESTLAWQQLDEVLRERWRVVAATALSRYSDQDVAVRKRWARAGTSIPTAVALDGLASDVVAALSNEDYSDPITAFRLISGSGRLGTILSLSSDGFDGFRPRRNAPKDLRLDVSIEDLITEWIQGAQLRDLCDDYLADVNDEIYRYEQLSEFISQTLEHFLPWLIGTLLQWANEWILPDVEELCPRLPAFIRYGVDNESALDLMIGGVRSRRLAHAVGKRFAQQDLDDSTVRDWLSEMAVGDWRVEFHATPTELADLLVYTRARHANVTSRVFAGERVEVPITPATGRASAKDVNITFIDEGPPPTVGATLNGQVIATIASSYQDDVRRLLSVGVPIHADISDGLLTVRVVDPTESAAWFASP